MSKAAADDFDWMDELPPARIGEKVKKGQALSPELKAKYAKNGTHREKGAENVKKGQQRLADGTIKSRTMTDKKWQRAIEFIAHGTPYGEIPKKIDVTKQIFNAYLITHVGAHKQMHEAKLLWLRHEFEVDEVDELLGKISMGNTLKSSAKELGWDDKKISRFYSLMRNDRAMREMYDTARSLQAESWVDDNIDIADDKAADWYTDDKGNERKNHEVIQRSNLRIQTRQWTMGVFNRKRFGDHKHVDHGGEITVNHAALLGGARKRLEGVQKQRGVTVEGEAVTVDRAGAQAK
jgi:hypothetical protein